MYKDQYIHNKLQYLIQSLEVPAASISGRANILHRWAEVRQVVGQVEVGRQEAWNKYLADLEEYQDRMDHIIYI